MILRTALALDTLTVLRTTRVNVSRNRRRTDKADCPDIRMSEKRIDCRFASIDKVDHSLGKACLLEKPDNELHRKRHSLRWFRDKSVSACDRIREKPQRHHDREIERSDRSNNAKRLPNHHLVYSTRNILEVVALHEHGDAASDLNVLDGSAQLCLCLNKRLSILNCDGFGDLIKVGFKQLLEFEKVLDPFLRWSASPFGKRASG